MVARGLAKAIIANAPDEFDKACARWRELYQAALDDQAEQNRIVLDGSVRPGDRKAAEARRRETEDSYACCAMRHRTHPSDFYTYRFRQRGFLPGYSFPRLPLAAHIPGVRACRRQPGNGEYLQRPRFLAISEFGPGAIIYHEGARYEIKRIQVPMSSGGIGTVDTGRIPLRILRLPPCDVPVWTCARTAKHPEHTAIRADAHADRSAVAANASPATKKNGAGRLRVANLPYRFSQHGPDGPHRCIDR